MNNSSLFIDVGQQLRRVELENVLHMQYAQGATTIEMINNKLMCCTTLKEVQNHLPAHFIRINRNVIINVKHLSAYYKQSQLVDMAGGRRFSVSRRSVPLLMEQMKAHFPLLR